MNKDDFKDLEKDVTGLKTYEFLINNLFSLSDDNIISIIDKMSDIDNTGQYIASSARYLNAVDSNHFRDIVKKLVSIIIDKDREHRYIKDVMTAIYGEDYLEKSASYSDDNNFRRLFKRIHPTGAF